jgi:hypothetical protein
MKAGHVVVRLRSGAGGRAWGPWRPVQTIARLTYRILCWYVLVCSHILHPPDAPAASLFTSRAHVTRRPQARPTSVRTSRALACLPAANSSKGPTRYIAPSSVDSPCRQGNGCRTRTMHDRMYPTNEPRGSLLPKRTPASVAANQDFWYRVGRYQRTELSLLQEFFDEDLGMDQEGDHMPHCIGTHPRFGVEKAQTVRARNEMALGNSTIALPMASHSRVKLRFASAST